MIFGLSVTSDKNTVKFPAHYEILLVQLVTNNKCALQVRQCATGYEKQLHWLPNKQLLILSDSIMNYKCINNPTPSFLCNKFDSKTTIAHVSVKHVTRRNTAKPFVYAFRQQQPAVFRIKTDQDFGTIRQEHQNLPYT